MNKKIIAIITIIIILLITIFAVIAYHFNTKKENVETNENETEATIPFEEAFSVNELEKSNIQTTKSTNEIIMKRYEDMILGIGAQRKEEPIEVSKTNSKVNFEDTKGTMMYIRNGQLNANIFQLKTSVKSLDEFQEAREEFIKISTKYLKITDGQKPEQEQLYNNAKAEDGMSIIEAIYSKEMHDCLKYKVKDTEYNINFYMQDGKLICEFVKILK